MAFPKLEKELFLAFIVLFIVSGILWQYFLWYENSEVVPKEGGEITEAIVGSPQFLNPIYAPLNNSDAEVCNLVFSSLLKLDSKGNLIPDLAESYQISPDGKIYSFTLKDNIYWQDKEKFSADDIIFTIQTIKKPEIQSPYLVNWQDVEVQKIDEKNVKFVLKDPYYPFIENFTLGIIPKHIFQDIQPSEFLAETSKHIIGTGPFKLENIQKTEDGKINKISLKKNDKYYSKIPYIDKFTFQYIDSEQAILENKEKFTNLGGISPQNKNLIKENFKVYSISLPRYFALFLNQNDQILKEKEIREALSYSVDKEKILKNVFYGVGEIANSPIPDGVFGRTNNIKKFNYDLKKADEILNELGWIKNKDGFREKEMPKQNEDENEVANEQKKLNLEINIATIDQQNLIDICSIIKDDWTKLGIKVNCQVFEGPQIIDECISKRNYQVLLFGQSLSFHPDPFVFWHSSKINYPGLNLSMYQNKKVDELLLKIRQETDDKKREEYLVEFQQTLTEDIPAIFIYSPHFLYPIKKTLKGVEIEKISQPSERFSNIENWYIYTKRVRIK